MDKELKGERFKTAHGRESYEIFHAEPDFLNKIALVLVLRFGFKQKGETLVGLGVTYMDFTNGLVTLYLGWDNWSGCFIFAEEPAGDQYVSAIGDCVDVILATSQ